MAEDGTMPTRAPYDPDGDSPIGTLGNNGLENDAVRIEVKGDMERIYGNMR